MADFYKNIIQEKSIVRQHIMSYNEFIDKGIKDILEANKMILSDLEPNFYIKYVDIRIGRPSVIENMVERKIFPNECRIRDLSYSSPILVDLEFVKKGEVIKKNNICIGKIPTMLRSKACNLNFTESTHFYEDLKRMEGRYIDKKECPLDSGGYFIIKGSEKALLIQEQLAKNRMIKSEKEVSVVSSTVLRKSKTSIYEAKGLVYVRNSSFKEDILFPIVLKALSFPLKQALKICPDLEKSFIEMIKLKITNAKKALDYIRKFTKEDPLNCLSENLVPNIPVDSNCFNRKGIYLCLMAKKIFETEEQIKNRKEDGNAAQRFLRSSKLLRVDNDNDFIGNKRYELSGQLFLLLFEDLFKFYNLSLKKSVDKIFARDSRAQMLDPLTFIQLQTNMITVGFERAITTGNWNVKRFKMNKSGVTETMSRLSHSASVGVLNRVVSQFEKTRKIAGPRALHTSSYGFLCPVDTPEGESCGLVKNLSLLAEITPDEDFNENVLFNLGVIDFDIDFNIFALDNTDSITDGISNITSPIISPIISNNIDDNISNNISNIKYNSSDIKYNNLDITPNITPNITSNITPYGITPNGITPNRIKTNITESLLLPCVFLNGTIIGTVKKSKELASKLRNKRRLGEISKFVSISEKGGDVFISSDNGRVCRPLIVLEKFFDLKNYLKEEIDDLIKNLTSKSKEIPRRTEEERKIISKEIRESEIKIVEVLNTLMKDFDFESLVHLGLIEYVDCNESLNIFVAMEQKDVTQLHTHLEISKASLLGYIASLIPYPDHNQSPRNTYQCAMGKQAIGLPFFNKNYRFDTFNILSYFQKPLATTDLGAIYNDELSAGLNVMVAVMAFSGYDIEDAIVVNKSSIERGLYRVESSRTEKVELQKYLEGNSDLILPFKDRAGNEIGNDRDGILSPGTKVCKGSVLINKHVPNDNSYKPEVARYPFKEMGQISNVILTKSGDDKTIVKSKVVQSRTLEVGDKLSSRHGQKGVVGKIVPQKDMPFNDQGVAPDLIMNPHGFPSRMTVGKILETLTGKGGSLIGKRGNASVFGEKPYVGMQEVLVEHGFSSTGKDVFTCGQTGEILEAYIFYGPIFYQRLKHMVRDKIHARAKGNRTTLTRQPTEGRSKSGGLRLGEMERDCLISYGVSNLLNERLMTSSDEYNVNVCCKCGIFVSATEKYQKCSVCKEEKCSTVRIPYACKVLIQELLGMGVFVKIVV